MPPCAYAVKALRSNPHRPLVDDERYKLHLGTVRGVPVAAHSSSIILLVLFAYFFSQDADSVGLSGIDVLLVAVLGAALLVASTFVHEMFHVAAGRLFNVKAREISLHFLGGLTVWEQPPASAPAMFVTSLAGPLGNVVIWALLVALGYGAIDSRDILLSGSGGPDAIDVTLVLVARWNLWLAIVNSLPALPLDGGKAFAAIVWSITRDWSKGIVAAAWVGTVSLVVMLFLGIFRVVDRDMAVRMSIFLALFVLPASWPYLRRTVARIRGNREPRTSSPRTKPDRSTRKRTGKRPPLRVVPAPSVDTGQEARKARRHKEDPSDDEIDMVWMRATHYADQSGRETVGTADLLLALLAKPHGKVATALQSQEVSFGSVWGLLSDGTMLTDGDLTAKRAIDEARRSGHGEAGVALALDEDCDAARVVAQLGGELRAAQEALSQET